MSQGGILKISSGGLPPTVPLIFYGNVGFATASSNQINFITSNSTVIFNASLNVLDVDFSGVNLALGNTLPFLTSGEFNIFLGTNAGRALTSGQNNFGVGFNALMSVTSGENNIAIGPNALITGDAFTDNIAIGANSMQKATGFCMANVAIGTGTLTNQLDVGFNVAVGFGACIKSTHGAYNVAVGNQALSANLVGTDNVAIGDEALFSTTGSSNIAIGSNAMVNMVGGSGNISIGYRSSSSYTGSESSNIIIGNAGSLGESSIIRIGTAQTGCYIAGVNGVNVGSVSTIVTSVSSGQIGSATLTAGTGISVIPSANAITLAVTGSVGTTLTGDSGGAISPSSGNWNLLGTANEITTTGSGSSITFSVPSSFIAPGSITSTTTTTVGTNLTLSNANSALTTGLISWSSGLRIHNFGSDNIFMGNTSGNGSLSGSSLIGIGSSTLNAATNCTGNIVIGSNSGISITSGSNNIAIGVGALRAITTTNGSTAIGFNSCITCTGNHNTCLGYQTGDGLTTGSSNTLIGYQAGTSYTSSESSNINIGVGVTGTASESNVTRIGVSQTSCYISGIEGVTVSNVNLVTINTSTSQLGSISPHGIVTTWTDEGSSFNAIAGNGYFVTATATATMPSSPSQGDLIRFAVDTTGTLTITANTGQTLRLGTTISAAAGTAVNTSRGDSIAFVYRSSDTEWIAMSSIGNWTIT